VATPASAPPVAFPPAPPPETWVVKRSDFQQTLDFKMQTALMNLQTAAVQKGLPYQQFDASTARDMACFICSGLRTRLGLVRISCEPSSPMRISRNFVEVALAAQAFFPDPV
jgi:hypothetical protein